MENQTALMEVMNEIVVLIVTIAESPVIAPLATVLGDVMVELSAMMEAMSKTVGPIVTTAEDPASYSLSLTCSKRCEQSAMMDLMSKTALQVLNKLILRFACLRRDY